MIIQNLGDDGSTDMTFTVPRGDYARALEIARGQLFATANPDQFGEAVTKDGVGDDGAVVLKPNCQWCDYGGLCGASLPEARS